MSTEVTQTTVNELPVITQIKAELESFFVDNDKAVSGNEKAAMRSRKASLKLRELFKIYKQVSLTELGSNTKVVKK